jgi:exodeoxyribonuclease VII large subunit
VRHYDLRLVLSGMRRQMEAGTAALSSVMRNVLLQHRVRVERFETTLGALSPLAILERGYALIFDSAGKLVKDASAVEVGDEISANLSRGAIGAVIREKRGS